jgi:hypothetical protein
MNEQNDQLTKNKNHSKLIWATVFVVILLCILLGTGVYFWREKLNRENNPIDSQKQQNITKTIDSNNSQIELPVIRFIPATFSQEEKEELMEKVINPFVDYEKETQNTNIISIQIKKYSKAEIDNQVYVRYMYGIDAIAETGDIVWLEREEGKAIDYWIPDCMGKCQFSESFKIKYPEVVKKYDSLQQQN